MVSTHLLIVLSFLNALNVINTSKDKLIEDNIHGLIASFGDFDSDKNTDVFLITENGKSLEILRGYITSEPALRKWPSIKCTFDNTNEIIVGVITSDFSGKAMMDVLVVTTSSVKDKNLFNLWLFRGNASHLDCNTSKALVTDVKSHPFVLDYNGDMISDFIVETNNCSRELWTRSATNTLQRDCPLEIQPKVSQSMRFPHSNAFINLDPFGKDMSPDVFISGTDHMEYWYDNHGFSPEDVVIFHYPDPKTYQHKGQSAFVDFNIDGQIDHILPVCKSIDDNICKDPQILGYDFNQKTWVSVMSDFSYGNSSLTFAQVSVEGQNLPITLRHGDIDGDGYIDFITVMKNNENEYKGVVLKNKANNNTFGRHFVIDWTSDKHLNPGLNVDSVAFFDLYEDGKLDILMTTSDDKKVRTVFAVVNTQLIAACFLKILVTSGLCYGSSCPRGNIPYGTNQFGPFVCYQLQDLEGVWQTGCAGQLSQTAHSALQMPYSVFGLGETPNFVENVYASIPSGKMGSRSSKWTQIVPDAQVVLIPFPPNDTNNWISKLFYTPSTIIFSTLITLAAICCLLVLIIGILHRKELLEDLADHEEYKRFWPESR